MAGWCWPLQTYCKHTRKCNWFWNHDRKCKQYAEPSQLKGVGEKVYIIGDSFYKRKTSNRRNSSYRRRSSSSSSGGTRRIRK